MYSVISIAVLVFSQSVKVVASSDTIRNDDNHTDSKHRKTQATGTNTDFTQLTLDEIYSEMDNLASSYPKFVKVTSTQDEFGLPSTCRGTESTNRAGCTTRYLVIEDTLIFSNKKAALALKQRPDVFLSGALHGDERVGPVAMIELAKILVLAASCESKQDSVSDCDNFYAKYTPTQAAWLARLVSTRRIVILPAPNAKGYDDGVRVETYQNDNGRYSSLDPNRDFSFDNFERFCMRTITARSINELFLKYLFQISMTYHGGIENITFEWGATSVPYGKVSPDDISQRILAEKMSLFAGELNPTNPKFYETGDMNDILYGVYGGFEDWVYAGSWKSDMTVQCKPDTYGGYDVSKTTYDDVSLSTFNILVEISHNKNPNSSLLGSEKSLLNAPFLYDNNVHNGYVAKHIRTALMAIDTVEPYVTIIRYRKRNFVQEFRPLRVLKYRWCKKKRKSGTKAGKKGLVEWNVGGSFSVDETFLLYGKWDDFPWSFNGINQLPHNVLTVVLDDESGKFKKSATQSGNTRWSDPTSDSVPSFKTKVDLTDFSRGDKIAVFAVAKVDQNWVVQPQNVWPDNVDVQSHMVHVRTNPDYSKSKSQREVRGRLYWISIPLTINVR
jgi:uncharacterized protein YsxB (DUF464 family)